MERLELGVPAPELGFGVTPQRDVLDDALERHLVCGSVANGTRPITDPDLHAIASLKLHLPVMGELALKAVDNRPTGRRVAVEGLRRRGQQLVAVAKCEHLRECLVRVKDPAVRCSAVQADGHAFEEGSEAKLSILGLCLSRPDGLDDARQSCAVLPHQDQQERRDGPGRDDGDDR